MRLMLLFVVVTILAVAGIERVTHQTRVSMDEWVCAPKLVRMETNNGPLYYQD